jgi:hypothetical protein
MTRARWFALVLAVAIVTVVWLLLPPAAERLTLPPDPLTARGAIHVHTVRSDGAGTPERVAGAAHRAGLDFVVLTDHGDAITRDHDSPRYIDGVLLIDAVEISTEDGHLLALGIGDAPYRLAGEARDVIEDVHRFGGFAIAAHPDSPKPELQWRDWKAAIDGLEWINADSEWRDEPRLTLTRALFTYWVRPGETMASLFDRPVRTLQRWDSLTVDRQVVAIAGHDVHARIPLSGQSDVGEGRTLGLPSYESAFRTLSQAVILEAPLGRTAESAARDAGAILGALRNGASYTVIDGLAGPASLDFHVVVLDGKTARMGESLETGSLRQYVASVKPTVPGAITVLFRDGREIATATNGRPLLAPGLGDTEGSYRVEVRLPRAPGTPPVPWIVSNPIFVRPPTTTVSPSQKPAVEERPLFDGTLGAWTIERAATSEGRVEVASRGTQRQLHFTWRLAGGAPSGQYAALVVPVQGPIVKEFTSLSVRAHARHPMRVSVQVRIPQGGGLRWKRSIYLDEAARDTVVDLHDMKPIEAHLGTALDLSRINTLLIVVDTVNALPGTTGECWIEDVRWRR